MKRRKILIIANHFPPSAVVGVQRTVKFVKYLPHFGWNPIVLTVRNSYSLATDEELLKEIPKNVPVYRTNCWGIRGSKYMSDEYYSMSQSLWKTIRKNLLKIFFFPFPDARIGWLFPAVVSGKKIIEKEQVDLIYTTSPSHSTHYVGYFLKKLMKMVWIADFRDPWAGTSDLQGNFLRRKIKGKFLEIYESIIVEMVDLIITTTESTRQDFLRRYPKVLSSEKICVITNGYDEEDFNFETIQRRKNEQFTLTYTGAFQSSYKQNTPKYFLEALKNIIIENPEVGENIRVYFIGIFNQRDKKLFSDPIFRNVITVKEHVTYKESLLHQLKSDVLLLFLVQSALSKGGRSIQRIPTKLYEYMRAQKPILALVHNGAARDFIEAHNLGITVDPMNVEEIKRVIMELYTKYQTGSLKVQCNGKILRRFDRGYLTHKMAEMLDKIMVGKIGADNSMRFKSIRGKEIA